MKMVEVQCRLQLSN